MQSGALTGFVAGGVATGSWKGALTGAFTGSLFGKLDGWKVSENSAWTEIAKKSAVHGLVGGVGNVLNGGKFGHGFASAGVTQSLSKSGLFKNGDLNGWDRVKNAVKAAIVGGTMSAATGGKFQNGAITGAFSRLLNDDASPYPKRGKPTKNYEEALQEQFDRVSFHRYHNQKNVLPNSSYLNMPTGGYIYFEDGYFVPSPTNTMSQNIIGDTERGQGAGAGNAGDYPQYPNNKESIPLVASIKALNVSSVAFSRHNINRNEYISQYIDSNIKLNYVITTDNVVFQLSGKNTINPSATIIKGKSDWID